MSGFGSQAYGSSPYGLGTPAVASPLEGSILRDDTTNETWGSRRIDPSTGDYVLDDNGRVLGMHDTKHLVLLAVKTDKGSSALRSLGHELRSIDRITPNFARRVDSTMRAAVQHLINRKLIEFIDTRVQIVRPGVAFVRLRWRDLLTGQLDELERNIVAPGQ
jgi:hypothetical protein